jgi:hypothetical protein
VSGGIYWLSSYPKSGNTWFRTFLQNLLVDGAQPVAIEELRTGAIASGRGWIDEILGFDSADLYLDEVDRMRPDVYRWSAIKSEEPSYHKIHDAYTHTIDHEPMIPLEATLGTLYFLRNPLDVAISFANHNSCSIDRAIENMGDPTFVFCKGKHGLPNQLRQKLLSWSGHVLSWVDVEGVEVIRYEDMKLAPHATFSRAARFLQLTTNPQKIDKAIRFSDIKELQRQEAELGFHEKPAKTERFFRKGVVGEWQEKLSEEQIERIIEDHREVMRRFGYLDDRDRPTIFTTHVGID